jgi:hypothetical protein
MNPMAHNEEGRLGERRPPGSEVTKYAEREYAIRQTE